MRLEKMLESGWVWYALGAMLFFSVANVTLKIITGKSGVSSADVQTVAALSLFILVVLAAAYHAGFLKISQETAMLALFFLVLASIGFVLMLKAFEQGKAALVTGVLALSTVGVAVISYVFLGERFSAREALAMVLATASVIALVY